MDFSKSLIVVFTLITTISFGQRYASDGNYNRAGAMGRFGIININTDNFEYDGQSAFMGGLTVRGRLYNDFGLTYGLDILHSSMNIQGRPLGETQQEDIRYTIIGAQVNLHAAYNIIKDKLAIDFGPSLLINGTMKLDNNGQRDNIINGYNSLIAEDIQQISRVNVFGVIGITGGSEHIRLTAQYQIGLTNIFDGLNKENLSLADPLARNFKGTASMLTGGVMFLF